MLSSGKAFQAYETAFPYSLNFPSDFNTFAVDIKILKFLRLDVIFSQTNVAIKLTYLIKLTYVAIIIYENISHKVKKNV